MVKKVQLRTKPTAVENISTRGIVAIVDDDPEISHVLSLWFEMHGFRSTCYASGESLLQSLDSRDGQLSLQFGTHDQVDLRLAAAVLDINLPGITGVELAQLLRHQAPELPIALITALRDEDRVRYGYPPAGVPYLKKPFDLDTLANALSSLLH